MHIFSLPFVCILALFSSSIAMRGALYRSGRSVPTIRGMDNRGYVTQDFLRFGRSSQDFGDEEDFLPHARFRALRNPFEFGFVV